MYSLKQGNRVNADEDDQALTAEKKYNPGLELPCSAYFFFSK